MESGWDRPFWGIKMRFLVLGPFRVQRDSGDGVDLSAPRSRSLLTLLLLAHGDVVPAERIFEHLWPGKTRPAQSRALRYQVWRLRDALEPDRPARAGGSVIFTEGNGYRLLTDRHFVDSEVFERHLFQARYELSASPGRARTTIEQGLRLWRGEPLSHVQYEDFAQADLRRLRALRVEAEILRVNSMIMLGQYGDAILELERLTASYPVVERFWCQLMSVLCLEGRQAEALATYAEAEAALNREVGLVTLPSLVRTRERISVYRPGDTEALQQLALG